MPEIQQIQTDIRINKRTIREIIGLQVRFSDILQDALHRLSVLERGKNKPSKEKPALIRIK